MRAINPLIFAVGTVVFLFNNSIAFAQTPTPTPMQATSAIDVEKINTRLTELESAKQTAQILLTILGIGSVPVFWSVRKLVLKRTEEMAQEAKDSAVRRVDQLIQSEVNAKVGDIRSYLDSELAILKTDLTQRFKEIDPGRITVKIPRNFDKERLRLERLGFRNFERYSNLGDECKSGCVVIKLMDPAKDRTDLDAFDKFLSDNILTLDEEQVHFLIFTDGRVPPETFRKFESMTYANSIITLANNLLTLARHFAR